MAKAPKQARSKPPEGDESSSSISLQTSYAAYPCPYCAFIGTDAKQLQGHLVGAAHNRPAVPPSVQPAAPSTVNGSSEVPVTDEIGEARRVVELRRLAAKDTEYQLALQQNSAKLQSIPTMNGPDPRDQVIADLQRKVDQLQTKQWIDDSNREIKSYIDSKFATIPQPRQENGHGIGTFLDAAKIVTDITKTVRDERQADNQYTLEGRKVDLQGHVLLRRDEREAREREQQAEFARRKEVQEQGTADKIVGLLEKGIDTLGSPISRAFGDSMRVRAGLPPVVVPGQPQPQAAQVQGSASPDAIRQQLAKLAQHEAEVQAVKQRLMQQLAAQPEGGPVQTNMDPIAASTPVTEASFFPGQVHTQRRGDP